MAAASSAMVGETASIVPWILASTQVPGLPFSYRRAHGNQRVVRRHHAVLRHERRSRGLQRRLPIPIRLVAYRRRGRRGRDQQRWPSFQSFPGEGQLDPSITVLRQPDDRTLDGDRPPEARLGRRQVAVLHYRRRRMVGRRGHRVGSSHFPLSRRTTKGRSRVGRSVRAGNMRSAMAGRGRASSSISTMVGQRFFDPADTCSPNCETFLNPREVSLKNYVFRTGLNWRFDWGKAPVAVMAKY